MLVTCEQLAARMGTQPHPSCNENSNTGKTPLTTSDKANTSQRLDANKDPFSTAKPRSKRKASKVEPDENATPLPRRLKEEPDIKNTGSQVADAIGNAQRLWIGERFKLGTFAVHLFVLEFFSRAQPVGGRRRESEVHDSEAVRALVPVLLMLDVIKCCISARSCE